MRPVLLVLAGFAVVALLLGWTRWLAGRRWAAVGNLGLGISAAVASALGWPVAAHLATYQPYRPGQSVAELLLEQTGSQRFRAILTRLPTGRMQVFELRGDQWRVEARSLAWIGRAAQLGLDSTFRLERLGSNTSAPTEAGTAAETGYQLGEARGIDLWAWSQAGSRWSRSVEARRLESPWRPMANGARFELRIGRSGLEVYTLNDAAAASMAAAP